MLHDPEKPKSEVSSYHPLSLTSRFGKILEKIVTKKVKDWCNSNIIINKKQSGFRSNRSMNEKITQLLKQSINKVLVTSALFLVIEKEFDQVWHTGLLL